MHDGEIVLSDDERTWSQTLRRFVSGARKAMRLPPGEIVAPLIFR
jgi:hypothetical protein